MSPAADGSWDGPRRHGALRGHGVWVVSGPVAVRMWDEPAFPDRVPLRDRAADVDGDVEVDDTASFEAHATSESRGLRRHA